MNSHMKIYVHLYYSLQIKKAPRLRRDWVEITTALHLSARKFSISTTMNP